MTERPSISERCNLIGNCFFAVINIYRDNKNKIGELIMGKTKIYAVIMAAVLLLPVFASCSSGTKKTNVVKEDDPWYESARFEMKKDIRKNDDVNEAKVCTSNDRVFSLYP